MKKISYKVIVVSTLFGVLSSSTLVPISTFASEISQPIKEGNVQSELAIKGPRLKETLEKASIFANKMNAYSLLLAKTPDINIEEASLFNDKELLNKLKNSQTTARQNALYWDNTVKVLLLNNFENIINYDTQFNSYYDVLKNAVKEGDNDVLKEGLEDLQEEIQHNKTFAQNLITELQKLRELISNDVREFGQNKESLRNHLVSLNPEIIKDEKSLEELIAKINDIKFEEIKGNVIEESSSIAGAGGFFAWVTGKIWRTVAENEVDKKNDDQNNLDIKIKRSKNLSDSITIASNSLEGMQKSLEDAIDQLQYMKTQWDDLDAQYHNIIRTVDKTSNKASSNKLAFILPLLNTAKDQWNTLKIEAQVLKEGVKELKIENK
ncbi:MULTISPECIES: HBL/NHE enterotoxin family protein [unclassified Bacillus (in: firmicutes)]|uniref:HBL/NHE enterotoxin family protein n=1 Tax=unclassified Bacillus (in: firmicutes) TaxID=185979 RepID=UPI000E35E34F|nr:MULTISPECIES: HBL/NHE enterotoxin family protein [unclassified Bacillus (in: firmicutes)]AXR17846.1 hemolysin [Bacillus sp. CR71]AXR23579.1 hemolysin [Bacillus sp. E25]